MEFKFLTELGIDGEIAGKIIAEHDKIIEAHKTKHAEDMKKHSCDYRAADVHPALCSVLL